MYASYKFELFFEVEHKDCSVMFEADLIRIPAAGLSYVTITMLSI
jgi:hypothetical protein